MSPESFHQTVPEPARSRESETLAQGFRDLPTLQDEFERGAVFKQLENDLKGEGFTLATPDDIRNIFNDNTLMTRSESFTRVIDTITTHDPITITNKGMANMCVMASGTGFKTAMQEGFSGRDVDGIVKTVVTFRPEHLESRSQVPATDELWHTKPDTAQVSLIGGGEIHNDDILMVSFRFPIGHTPKEYLTDDELEMLEEENISFVVRHYITQKERAVH